MENTTNTSKWELLKERLPEESADKIIEALKELYSTYSRDMLDWLASLYDPKVGGWYYSESARDTEGFLPDIESTIGALCFVESCGMVCGPRGSFISFIPEKMKEQIVKFTKSLQEDDGYFYHPQWGREITKARQSRDLNSSSDILRFFGAKPKYPLPTGGSSEKQGGYDISNAPERYRSVENFKKYLEELDITGRSYDAGNELAASAQQTAAYGRMLGENLHKMTARLLNEKQNPENGLWSKETDIYGVNGLHKITTVYNWAEMPIPNAERGVESALKIILDDEPIKHGVDLINPWAIIGTIIYNLETYDERGKERAGEIIKLICKNAPECILKSKEKIKALAKPHGTFSYADYGPSVLAQGARACVSGIAEGDVNGNNIASSALVSSIMRALGIRDYIPPMFSDEDTAYYKELLVKVSDV